MSSGRIGSHSPSSSLSEVILSRASYHSEGRGDGRPRMRTWRSTCIPSTATPMPSSLATGRTHTSGTSGSRLSPCSSCLRGPPDYSACTSYQQDQSSSTSGRSLRLAEKDHAPQCINKPYTGLLVVPYSRSANKHQDYHPSIPSPLWSL